MCSALMAGVSQIYVFAMMRYFERSSLNEFLEYYRAIGKTTRLPVALTYLTMICSSILWLYALRRQHRSLPFYMVIGVLLCQLQEASLSYFGHYKINDMLMAYANSNTVVQEWQSLREELNQFYYLHFAMNLTAFVIGLAAIFIVKGIFFHNKPIN
ncbi:hypothetical protein DOE51_16840 [Bdellovibrio sp. NC01]|nr:hypothetical protein DOE51_16840 [Bdellovibrio sp. NC01]